MADRWSSRGQTDSPYHYEQIRSVLEEIGVYVVYDTTTNFLCYCPYHGNRDTPSFSIDYSTGLYMCFNPACMESGNIFQLMRYMIKCNDFEATRLLQRYGKESEKSFEERMAETAKKEEWVEWHPDLITKFRSALYENAAALNYLEQRGFVRGTLQEFNIGFSEAQQMVTVPVHSPSGLCVGIVGRSIRDKTFKNSSRLPNTRLLYNYHRAKTYGDIVIVTESSFDTMRVHQAGFPNVVGTLGGYMNAERYALLDRTFKTIIIMTDDDELQFYKGCKKCDKRGLTMCAGHNPGRALGLAIAENMKNKQILWASAGYKQNYVNGAKDAGDMSDADIAKCINGAVSHLEYLSWGLA